MSELSEFVKYVSGLLKAPQTITEEVIDVAKKNAEKPKSRDVENKIISDILKIVEESSKPSEIVLR